MKAAWFAAGCLAIAPVAGAQEETPAWIEYLRREEGKQTVEATVRGSGAVRIRVTDDLAGRRAPVEGALQLSRYRIHYLRRLIESTALWECPTGPDPFPSGVDEVRLTIRDGDRRREIRRVLAATPAAGGEDAGDRWRAFEGCFRWVTEIGRAVVTERLAVAASVFDSRPELARDGLRAAVRDLAASSSPFLREPATQFYVWRVPDGHPCQTLPSALFVAEKKGDTGRIADLCRSYLEAYVAMEQAARDELEWYVEFACPGEREADYLDAWETSREVHARAPERWAPAPWDWAQPTEGFREARLTPPEEPTAGLRFAVPAGCPAATYGGTVAGPWPEGFTPLGSQSLPEGAKVAFAVRESPADFSVALALETLAAATGGHRVRSLQVRRGPTHRTDVIVRRDDGVHRWIAVQSGTRTALAHLTVSADGYRRLKEEVAARLAASLEPLPLRVTATAEPGKRITLGRLDLDVPACAEDDPGAGANPDSRDWLLARGANGQAGVRLCVRRLPGARPGLDAGTQAWGSVGRPARPAERAASLPEPDADRGGWIAQVWSAGMGMVRVRAGRIAFGADRLPAYWAWIQGDETFALVAVVCEADDPASLARARAWLEAVVASAE